MAISDYWRGKGSAVKPIEIKNFIEAATSLVKYVMPKSKSQVTISGLNQGLAATDNEKIVINYGLIADQVAPFSGDKLDELLALTLHEVAHDMYTISSAESEKRLRRLLKRTNNVMTEKDLEFCHLLHSIMEDRLIEKWIGVQYPGAKPYIDKLNGQYIPKELTDEIIQKVKDNTTVNTVYQVLLTELPESEIRKLPAIARKAYRHKLAVREKMETMTQVQRLAKTIQLYTWLKKLFGWEHPVDPKEDEPNTMTNPNPDGEKIETSDSDKQDGPDADTSGAGKSQDKKDDEEKDGEDKQKGGGSDEEDDEEKDDESDDDDAASDNEDDDEADDDDKADGGDKKEDTDDKTNPGGNGSGSKDEDDEDEDDEDEDEDESDSADGDSLDGSGHGSDDYKPAEEKPEPKTAKIIDLLKKNIKPNAEELQDIQNALAYKMEDISVGNAQVVLLHPNVNTTIHNRFLNQIKQNLFQLRGKHNVKSFVRGMNEGTLDKRRLQHVITDGNCFKQIGAKTKTAMQVCLLVDFSSSMRYNPTMEMMVLLHEVFSKVPGLELMILGYYSSSVITIFKICDPRDNILKLDGVKTDGGTPSYEALEAARGQMVKFPLRGKRLLIHVTDGDPNNGCHMAEKIAEIKKCGITTKCIGINMNHPANQILWYGENNFCDVRDMSEAKVKIPKVINEFFDL
ncbi:MAG: VWA domain-containing protein [Deltaproteobacteria bacterium]|nr:VWA domain-containing protein [Deltaproteobacteria bacterium]